MDLWQVLLLGIVQGITEFLPISSTAHLRIVPALLGWPDPGAAVSAILQLGSVLALLVYFRRDLFALCRTLLGSRTRPATDASVSAASGEFSSPILLRAIVLGSIPIGVLGFLGQKWIHGQARSLWVVAGALASIGVLLWLVERLAHGAREESSLRVSDGWWVGLAQSLALVPGVSRSGISIVAGLSLGLRRDVAARFSFLLGIPALCAAGIFELYKIREEIRGEQAWLLLVGVIAAFVSSYLAIDGLLRFLKTRTVTSFAIYRIALAGLIVALLLTGKLSPLG